jgi:diguanylate cyclase (GGDEF)-like protein
VGGRNSERLGALNTANVALMFVVIVAIGSCGVFALTRSRQSAAHVVSNVDRASDFWRLTSALNLECAMVGAVLIAPGPQAHARVLAAHRAFDGAFALVREDNREIDVQVLRELDPRHVALDRYAQAIVTLATRGEIREAQRIFATQIMPNARQMRTILNRVSNEAFDASRAEQSVDQRFSNWLEWVTVVVTGVGILLMVGIMVVLARYKRGADLAVADKIAALEEAALTDNLTKLGNHRAFYDDFARELARARRHDRPLALALIDIDDFKGINDSHGHAHGDDVLTILGTRMGMLRQEDRAYRVGGDEFAVLLVETEPRAVGQALVRLQEDARLMLKSTTLSIGYVNIDFGDPDFGAYECADSALYEAKRRGRNTIVCFDEIKDKASVFSPRKADAVRTLIARELLDVAFQPIWDLASLAPLGFEALARPDPSLALEGPQEAFDVAQRIRAVVELDWLCIRKALAAARRLPAGATMFLNVSPESLAHRSFDPEVFVASLRAAGIAPAQIVVELTERRIDDPGAIVARARALRALGVRMALDDTGSGHAGLEILSQVQLDYVKIDRSLLVKALEDRGARGVLAGVIAISRATGSYLIAEGVENARLFDFACGAHVATDEGFPGIRGVQGFLLGKPETGEIDLAALAEHRALLSTHVRAPVNAA